MIWLAVPLGLGLPAFVLWSMARIEESLNKAVGRRDDPCASCARRPI